MVMTMTAPTVCSIKLIDDIIAERQKGKNAAFFNGISLDWRDRVRDYINACGVPATIPTWPEVEHKKTSFLNLYLSPKDGSVQGKILTAMRQHGLTLCPSCGEDGAPNTLDHYLPKGKYPHFCVTPMNLFPMCDACQDEKKEKTHDAATARFFLHPYFDVFVANRVLELRISPPFDVPTFDLVPVGALLPSEAALIEAHVRELNIIARYAHFFKTEYQRLFRLVEGLREAKMDISTNLSAFRKSRALPTPNSWQCVFYDGVLSNPGLMNHLQNGVFPPYR